MALAVVMVTTGIFLATVWRCAPFLLLRALNEARYVASAMEILPIVMLAVYSMAASTVFLGALDGANRIDLRAGVVCLAAAAQLGVTLIAVPFFGLRGLALGYLCQSFVAVILSGLGAHAVLGSLIPGGGRFWIWERFRSMLRYGGGLQAMAIAQMTFDPIVRGMLTHYGSLVFAGHFEMATRLVFQARSLLVAGCQALIPYVASEYGGPNDTSLKQLYLRAVQTLVNVGIPFFLILLAALPALSIIWVGSLQRDFLWLGLIAIITWMANALIVPAYYVFLGKGRLRWNAASQVVIAILNLVLSMLLGSTAGGYGVAIGSGAAVVIGSALVIYGFHRDHNLSIWQAMPTFSAVHVVALLGGVAIFLGVPATHPGLLRELLAYAGPIILAVVVAAAFRRNAAVWSELLSATTRR
jgi:O-antigen/teichoic acid export membrane protein